MAPSVVEISRNRHHLLVCVRLDRGIEQNDRGAKVDHVVAFLDTPESMYARGDDSSASARQRFLLINVFRVQTTTRGGDIAQTLRQPEAFACRGRKLRKHNARHKLEQAKTWCFHVRRPQKWATFRNDFVLLVISLYFAKELACMNAVASSPCRRSSGAWVFYWIWRREARRG